MNIEIVRYLFSQFNLDSGAITMLGPVMHQLTDPGVYRGEVLVKDQPVGSFFLRVGGGCPAAQVDIDLGQLPPAMEPCCDDTTSTPFCVAPKGYAVFHVSGSRGGYAVVLSRTTEKREKVFDSRELASGDIFAASLLRPGRYQITNVLTGAKGEIVVAYPKVGERPYQPDPVSVECSEKEFRPARISVGSAQGQVYQLRARGRLRIELVEADDGPGSQTLPKYAAFGKKPPDQPSPK